MIVIFLGGEHVSALNSGPVGLNEKVIGSHSGVSPPQDGYEFTAQQDKSEFHEDLPNFANVDVALLYGGGLFLDQEIVS